MQVEILRKYVLCNLGYIVPVGPTGINSRTSIFKRPLLSVRLKLAWYGIIHDDMTDTAV